MRRRPRDLVNLMSLEYREETDDASPDEAGLLPTDTAGKPVYTVTILLGISLVFLTQVYVGLNERQAFAAAFDKPVFRDGSYWLILTGATVHGSWLHVLMNSYALFSFGRIFEELSNHHHYFEVRHLAANIPESTLRLTPAQVRAQRAEWRSLLGL